MDILYNIGSFDIFRNLRYVLLFILIVFFIGCMVKIKTISDNYKYLNRDITMLETLKKLTDFEFKEWTQEYFRAKGYEIDYIYTGLGKIKNMDSGIEYLVYTNRKYNILDKEEAKYIDGFSIVENCKKVFVLTLGEIDKGFFLFLKEEKIQVEFISKDEFNIKYEDFLRAELNVQ
ncbi:hypothetical protein [uncultured Clostridium sp.]|uniref:hypothetical protein n=1 Tax=uncultured Clostridium sp. TaxID=59620 RepID=UPI0026017991|nr:hypothetical protein [uncultured Clostridium sp.]